METKTGEHIVAHEPEPEEYVLKNQKTLAGGKEYANVTKNIRSYVYIISMHELPESDKYKYQVNVTRKDDPSDYGYVKMHQMGVEWKNHIKFLERDIQIYFKDNRIDYVAVMPTFRR